MSANPGAVQGGFDFLRGRPIRACDPKGDLIDLVYARNDNSRVDVNARIQNIKQVLLRGLV